VIGGLGLIALLASAGARCMRLVSGRLPEAYAEIVPRWWLLAVIGPVMAVAGSFYEVLHFRQLWTWLGIVAALSLVAYARGEDRPRGEDLAPGDDSEGGDDHAGGGFAGFAGGAGFVGDADGTEDRR
jgi:hypothetical protein